MAHGEAMERRFDDGSHGVIGAMIEVHRALGPGLLEAAYETCVEQELVLRGFRVERQKALEFEYKGAKVDCAYRLDLVVDDRILIELKAVNRVSPVHVAQVLTYLRLSGLRVGLLVNFNVPTLLQGLRRLWA